MASLTLRARRHFQRHIYSISRSSFASSKQKSAKSPPSQQLQSILGEHSDEEALDAELDRGSTFSDGGFAGVTGHSDKADFANARIGDVLEIPYEVTASNFWRELWQSVFYQQDRIHTSLAYCTSLRSRSSVMGAIQDGLSKGIHTSL